MADEKNEKEATPVAPTKVSESQDRPNASDIAELPVSGPAKVESETPVKDVEVEVAKDQVDAMVVQPREPDADKVNVHEVSVALDERVDYVIVPPEGRGSLDLPIHALDAERPEEFFAREASKSDDE
jgi:hypothetical protein